MNMDLDEMTTAQIKALTDEEFEAACRFTDQKRLAERMSFEGLMTTTELDRLHRDDA